jgi:osmotically-inducible protein OsmY
VKTDLQLRQEVAERINFAPGLARSEIGIAVKGGVVTLTGSVDSYSELLSAESCAESVSGVLGVANDVVVGPAVVQRISDTSIAHEAVHALLWDIQVPEGCVKVAVEDGWIDLLGEVEWEYQRRVSEAAVSHLRGVRGVNNLITLKPREPLARRPRALPAA